MKTNSPELSDLHALYLEDEVLIGLDGEMILEDLGFKSVTLVQDLEAAYACFEKKKVNFVMLDINLGDGRTSLPLATELQSAGVPFFFASGYNKREHVAAKFFDVPFVTKPFDEESIAEAVSLALQEAAAPLPKAASAG
jgi:DNA-binding NtrC family response regulator